MLAHAQPPHDLDAEAAVLSSALLDTSSFELAEQSGLEREHFYAGAHQRIWSAMAILTATGRCTDVITVASHLRDTNRIKEIGGAAYLARLTDATPAVGNVAEHARIITELWRRRSAIQACQQLAAEGYSTNNPDAWLDKVRRIGDEVAKARGTDFIALSPDDVWGEQPEVDYTCKALDMAPGPVHLVAGYGFSGKTLALQSLGLSMAAGLRAWGRFKLKHGTVAHIDYEQGRRVTSRRYQRLALGNDIDHAGVRNNLRVYPYPDVYLDSQRGLDALTRVAVQHDFVFIDSLRACAPSIDENSSDVRKLLDGITRVSDRTGATIVLVHHAKKPSKTDSGGLETSIRGSGAIFDACGSVVVFSGGESGITVSHLKARESGITLSPFELHIEDVPIGEDRRGGVRLLAKEKRSLRDVQISEGTGKWEADLGTLLKEIQKRGQVTQRSMRQTLPFRAGRLKDMLEELRVRNAIRFEGNHWEPVS